MIDRFRRWKTFECPNCGNVVQIKSRRGEDYDCPNCETTLIPTKPPM